MADITIKDITIEFIQNYCKSNNQTEWYNNIVFTPVKHTIYPKNEKGKYDKKQPPIGTKEEAITFIELRTAFIAAFMPELAPKKKASTGKMFVRL